MDSISPRLLRYIKCNIIATSSKTPKTIAIISSETAAGYEDFISHLQNNDYGFNNYINLDW